MNKILNILMFFSIFSIGISVFITQKLPQGKFEASVDIENYGYILGTILILIGLFGIYKELKK